MVLPLFCDAIFSYNVVQMNKVLLKSYVTSHFILKDLFTDLTRKLFFYGPHYLARRLKEAMTKLSKIKHII